MPQPALAALGLPGAESPDWRVRGRRDSAAEIHQAQWQWYRDNPWVVDAGYTRHRDTLDILGLA